MLTRIGRAALVPWWTAQLLTGTKSFERNARDRQPAAQPARAARSAGAARARGRANGAAAAWNGLVSAADRADFARDGFVDQARFSAASQTFAELRDQVRTYRGPLREIAEGDTIMRKIALDPRTLDGAAGARRRAALAGMARADPLCRQPRRRAGGLDPEHSRHACDGPPDPQTVLHADTFHPTVKAWLFLTDVAADAGPFTYVPGSHRLTPRAARMGTPHEPRRARFGRTPRSGRGRSASIRRELRDMGLPEPRVFAVPANTLVVADTFGFHARGPSAGRSLRVEIWAYGRRSPFVPWAGLDPWTGAGLARRSLIGWQLGDLLERAGIKPHRWRCARPVGVHPALRPGLNPFRRPAPWPGIPPNT